MQAHAQEALHCRRHRSWLSGAHLLADYAQFPPVRLPLATKPAVTSNSALLRLVQAQCVSTQCTGFLLKWCIAVDIQALWAVLMDEGQDSTSI